MARHFNSGDFYTVRFVTGGYGNRYSSKAEAVRDGQDSNRYSETKYGERVVREVVRFKNWEEVGTFPV